MATTSAKKMEEQRNVFGATLSRRQFVKTGGSLVVGVSLVGSGLLKSSSLKGATFKNSIDPTLANSWIEIHPDNTILIRTGNSDFGQGTVYTAYRQIVADLTGRAVVVPHEDELVACGAAVQAAAVLHGCDFDDLAAAWSLGTGDVIEPDTTIDRAAIRAAYADARAARA